MCVQFSRKVPGYSLIGVGSSILMKPTKDLLTNIIHKYLNSCMQYF